MKSATDYVQDLRAAKGLHTDYALSKFLGLSKQAVSKWKTRGVLLSTETAWRIAEALNVDPLEVIAAVELERAMRDHDADNMRLWSRRLRDLSAALCLVLVGVFTSAPAPASALSGASNGTNSVYYVKLLTRLRRRMMALCHDCQSLTIPSIFRFFACS